MSILDDIGTAVGMGMDVFNAGASIANTAYNKEQQKIQREREDNAVQRRVKDLQAAGLNPVLAAGSAASSSAPINVGTPSVSGENVYKAVQYGQAKRQQSLTEAQLDLVKAQTEKADADAFFPQMLKGFYLRTAGQPGDPDAKADKVLGSMLDRLVADNEMAIRSKEEYLRNTDIARSQGIPSNSSVGMDAVAQGQLIANVIDSVKVPSTHNIVTAINTALKNAGSIVRR